MKKGGYDVPGVGTTLYIDLQSYWRVWFSLEDEAGAGGGRGRCGGGIRLWEEGSLPSEQRKQL